MHIPYTRICVITILVVLFHSCSTQLKEDEIPIARMIDWNEWRESCMNEIDRIFLRKKGQFHKQNFKVSINRISPEILNELLDLLNKCDEYCRSERQIFIIMYSSTGYVHTDILKILVTNKDNCCYAQYKIDGPISKITSGDKGCEYESIINLRNIPENYNWVIGNSIIILSELREDKYISQAWFADDILIWSIVTKIL